MNLTATVEIQERDAHGNRTQPVESNRHRALARLYERRAAVDHLINALERYQQELGRRTEQSQFEEISVVGMLS